MRRQLAPALIMTLVLTVLTGLVYPLLVTGIGHVAFPHRADGSLVTYDGHVVGSALIGQSFTKPAYFHPRPSVSGYDAMASGGSNLGPSSQKLLAAVRDRVAAYRKENDLPSTVAVPVDAVTASGSGLDPHISLENALLQVHRVAQARRMTDSAVRGILRRHVEDRPFGVLGEKVVNVLELNLDLDRR